MLKGKTIVLGVTSSIAAYKACDLISILKREKANVFVIMTKNAVKIITPLTMQTLSQNQVYLDEYNEKESLIHISLAKKADLLLIAPATANIIGKAAHGVADDLLSTAILSVKVPVIFAPAMNTHMWEKEVVEDNVKILKNRGYHFIGPVEGELACGDYGIGKMADVSEIVKKIESIIDKKKELSGIKILVTGGGTREKIDDVRFIGNNSSGKMGYYIAKEAVENGADVTYISGISSINYPKGVKLIKAETSMNMKKQVLENMKNNDVLIMSAAVSDFKPVKKINGKLKKESVKDIINIQLEKTDDILKEAVKRKGKKMVIGFSLGTGDFIKEACKKLKEKKLDYILANTVESISSDKINAAFINKNGDINRFGVVTKEDCAKSIINEIKNVCRSRCT